MAVLLYACALKEDNASVCIVDGCNMSGIISKVNQLSILYKVSLLSYYHSVPCYCVNWIIFMSAVISPTNIHMSMVQRNHWKFTNTLPVISH